MSGIPSAHAHRDPRPAPRDRVLPLIARTIDFNERDELFVNSQPIVGELALDLVLGGEVFVLVEAKARTQEVRDQQARVAFVGIALNKIDKRLV
jgi:proline racemase